MLGVREIKYFSCSGLWGCLLAIPYHSDRGDAEKKIIISNTCQGLGGKDISVVRVWGGGGGGGICWQFCIQNDAVTRVIGLNAAVVNAAYTHQGSTVDSQKIV